MIRPSVGKALALACVLADVAYNVHRHEISKADRERIKAEQAQGRKDREQLRDQQERILKAVESLMRERHKP